MKLPFTARARKLLLDRCSSDTATKLRRRYEVWYHTFEEQSGSRVRVRGREYVMLSSNDYLGLSTHPKVVEAGQKALARWGSSTTGARLANGSRGYHTELEDALAAFLGKEACHVSNAGYISCMSSIAAFAQRGDVVLVDKNIHSCVWDGIRLSGATVERFAHNSPAHLREVLEQLDSSTAKLLVIEGVYSMEGHVAPLPEFTALANEFGCMLVMDDAHGLGVLGRQGRGTADHFGLVDQVDLICGSLSKALSSTGGFVAASHDVVEYLRTHSRQTIFSAAITPAQAACARASLEVMQTEPEHLERLWANTRRYRAMVEALGLDTWSSDTPAVPIVLGSKERAYDFWRRLMDKGVFSVMSIAPGVPVGKDLVRTAVSARHTEEDFAIIERALAYAARKS
ncbi:aminotransferase class I/II-fold pyridoxal phosphate-dependent enzyme [Congregicoccus parvus]|uniref:aminotransferase class I/II-fold pyridoxal phosphate-dependent enzyme n=1 Tax=Congregicoccus parvus TaxID=3081749 RepID=UPI003FA5CFA8